PVINPRLLANRRFFALGTVALCAQGGHFGTIYLLPLLLASEHDVGVMAIGVHLLPGALCLAFFGMAGGILARRLGNRPLVLTGAIVMFLAATLMQTVGLGGGPIALAAQYAFLAAGYGMVTAGISNATTAELDPEVAGVGLGVYNLLFFLGGAIAVALAGSILRNRAGSDGAWSPWVDGAAGAYSDAATVILALAAAGMVLSYLALRREERSVIQASSAPVAARSAGD
ncbi:MAG: MFS transporter, partial [Tepidiformaceae bacterium]